MKFSREYFYIMIYELCFSKNETPKCERNVRRFDIMELFIHTYDMPPTKLSKDTCTKVKIFFIFCNLVSSDIIHKVNPSSPSSKNNIFLTKFQIYSFIILTLFFFVNITSKTGFST